MPCGRRVLSQGVHSRQRRKRRHGDVRHARLHHLVERHEWDGDVSMSRWHAVGRWSCGVRGVQLFADSVARFPHRLAREARACSSARKVKERCSCTRRCAPEPRCTRRRVPSRKCHLADTSSGAAPRTGQERARTRAIARPSSAHTRCHGRIAARFARLAAGRALPTIEHPLALWPWPAGARCRMNAQLVGRAEHIAARCPTRWAVLHGLPVGAPSAIMGEESVCISAEASATSLESKRSVSMMRASACASIFALTSLSLALAPHRTTKAQEAIRYDLVQDWRLVSPSPPQMRTLSTRMLVASLCGTAVAVMCHSPAANAMACGSYPLPATTSSM